MLLFTGNNTDGIHILTTTRRTDRQERRLWNQSAAFALTPTKILIAKKKGNLLILFSLKFL